MQETKYTMSFMRTCQKHPSERSETGTFHVIDGQTLATLEENSEILCESLLYPLSLGMIYLHLEMCSTKITSIGTALKTKVMQISIQQQNYDSMTHKGAIQPSNKTANAFNNTGNCLKHPKQVDTAPISMIRCMRKAKNI